MFQFAEHWIPILDNRMKNIHFKEFTKKGTDYSLETFRPLLDGTTNWPAVIQALDRIGYDGYVTFEYFHPYYPEAVLYQTSDSLDRMLGRLPQVNSAKLVPRVIDAGAIHAFVADRSPDRLLCSCLTGSNDSSDGHREDL